MLYHKKEYHITFRTLIQRKLMNVSSMAKLFSLHFNVLLTVLIVCSIYGVQYSLCYVNIVPMGIGAHRAPVAILFSLC